MQEVSLKNPLTDYEKAQMLRLCGHDMLSEFFTLGSKLAEKEPPIKEIWDYMSHFQYLTKSLALFGLDNVNLLGTASERLDSLLLGRGEHRTLNTLKYMIKGELEVSVTDKWATPRNFVSLEPILYATFRNLVKNAENSQISKSLDLKTTLEMTPTIELPEDVLYVPEGARDYDLFASFNIRNLGPEFKREDALELLQESNRRGFGMYFTGLVSKFLRAPVDVQSVKHDSDESKELYETTVSLYHPYYAPED